MSNSNLIELKEKVENLITGNKIEIAINELKAFTEDETYKDLPFVKELKQSILIFQKRHGEIIDKDINNTITEEDKGVETNLLSDDILKLLNKIPDKPEDLEVEPQIILPPKKKKALTPFRILLILFFTICLIAFIRSAFFIQDQFLSIISIVGIVCVVLAHLGIELLNLMRLKIQAASKAHA